MNTDSNPISAVRDDWHPFKPGERVGVVEDTDLFRDGARTALVVAVHVTHLEYLVYESRFWGVAKEKLRPDFTADDWAKAATYRWPVVTLLKCEPGSKAAAVPAAATLAVRPALLFKLVPATDDGQT